MSDWESICARSPPITRQPGNRQRAAEYLSQAGEQQLKVSAFRDARKTFETALQLLEPETVYSRDSGQAGSAEVGRSPCRPPLSR